MHQVKHKFGKQSVKSLASHMTLQKPSSVSLSENGI